MVNHKIYESIIKDVSKIIKKHLNELNSTTLYNAANKQAALLNNDDYILSHTDDELVAFDDRKNRFKEAADIKRQQEELSRRKSQFSERRNSILQKQKSQSIQTFIDSKIDEYIDTVNFANDYYYVQALFYI